MKRQQFKGKKIWFHCASLGEFEQGRPIIETMKKQYPDLVIIITFFSSSGYEVQKNYELADYVCYLPFDLQREAQKFVELLKPDMAIFIKYEFWYNFLQELKEHNIPTFSVSAIFRPQQQFFKKNGRFFREMLSCFTYFFVQNEQSKKLLLERGYKNVAVSGDTRFDRVLEIAEQAREIEGVELFKANVLTMVIGSSWPDDISVLLPIINDTRVNLKYVIAPHEVEKTKIQKLCKELRVDYQLLSNLNMENLVSSKVVIVDCIGLLSSLYRYGDIAYVGGAFGDGLHNILEAATYGMPVIFGKGKDNYKFQEATELLKLGGAFEVADVLELKSLLNQFASDDQKLRLASKISEDYVHANSGATDKIMNYLDKYLG